MDRKTSTVKKSIVRNIEVPPKLSEKHRNVRENFSMSTISDSIDPKRPPDAYDQLLRPISTTSSERNLFEHNLKYKVPQVNTVERLQERIDKIKLTKELKSTRLCDLTPRTKAIVNHEITKKLNFPLDQHVYKNLIPINVNDSLLVPPEQRKPFRKKYIAKSNKDPIPELADFLTPIPPLKHVLQFYNKPPMRLKPDNCFYKSIYELHVNFHPHC